jgi:tetratricopeptide (TPR) repeat protein
MWLLAIFTAFGLPVQASAADVQRWFESGRYDQVIESAADATDPRTVYLSGLSSVELDRVDEARRRFEQLRDRPGEDGWRHIGASAALLNDPVTREDAVVGARAVEAARLAVMLDDANAYAHYQLGRALGRQRAYPLAAAAFDEAIAREPRFAYAHYYAGLSYYQAGRTDLMAVAFDAFLTLAPDAPERSRVESIMRTLRGRR